MALKRISLRGFRNLEPTALEFSPAANYVFGPNSAGKTNLLEAVYYLAIGRSFRRCPDSELLGFDQDVLVVSGTDDAGQSAEIRFDGREKRLVSGSAVLERLSDYFGWLPVVVLLLEDIELVRGGPGLRRGFLDTAMAKADRSYISVLGAYRRVLLQRNRLLETGATDDLHSVWEEELVQAGVTVCEQRRAVIDRLLTGAAAYFLRLAHEPAEFTYWSSVGTAADIGSVFRQRLAATRQRSLQLKHTLVGPHRDDIRIQRKGRDLRRFGSVGEQRLAGIALRLAEADLLGAVNQRPVFLLDEIASELDEEKAGLVFALIAERGQMVYAAARRLQGSTVQQFNGSTEEPAATLCRETAPSVEPLELPPLESSSAAKEFHVEAGRVIPR